MTLIIGHRGGRNVWPENGMTGFRELLACGADGVEFDVHLTRAGEMLIIHDALLDRTTDTTGLVAELPAGQHRNVLLRGGSDRIPTLDEILELYVGTDLELHVELKADADGRPYPGLIEKALAAIDRFGLRSRSILTSFSPDVLVQIRGMAPDVRTLCSMHQPVVESEGLLSALDMRRRGADLLAVQKDLLKSEWTVITQTIPLDRLGAWVPNSQSDLQYWLTQGLRQITTDDPVLACNLRATLKDD